MSTPGVLELFHPAGSARRVVVFGSACPPALAVPSVADATVADLIVIAPSSQESHEPEWMERTVRAAAKAVAPDGVVYVLAPRGGQARVREYCRRAGLVLERDVLHIPNWHTSHYAIPLYRPALARVADTSLSLTPGRRRLVLALLALPGAEWALSRMRESVSVVARPRDARPLCAWLFDGQEPSRDAAVILRAKWRAGLGTVLFQAVDRTGELLLLGKTTLSTESKPSGGHETDMLARFGPDARAAGAAVPEARSVSVGVLQVTVENAVAGIPAAILLNTGRLSVEVVVEKVAGWLEAWNLRAVVRRPLEAGHLERAVLEPARSLAPDLDSGAQYVAWLEARCHAVVGDVVPLVATHGDLTMSNVLFTKDRSLGIVDWEMAAPDGLPLGDFWYAATDAAAAVDRYVDRRAAFVRCIRGDGALPSLLATHAARLARTIGVSDAFAMVCFHGCWLHHAVNERRKRLPGEARPFRDIVQWLASHPLPAGVPAGTAA